jgi:hypothetical protein
VEALVAMTLTLIILIGTYAFLESSQRDYVAVDSLAMAQATGRAAIDLFGMDAREAGYDPMGVSFDGVPQGDATSVRLMSDRDGDGTVGTASESDEDLTYVFKGPTGGLYELVRGVDLNGDGDFDDADESEDSISSYVVPIDSDEDGTDEAFLSYDATPPDTRRIRIAFGVRTDRRDMRRKEFPVVSFESEILLRNMR